MGVFSKCRIPLGKTCKEMLLPPPPDFPEKTIEATPQLQTHTNVPPPPPQTKKFVISISNSHISLSFLLTINTFIHSSRCRSSLKKTIPDSRPKQAKSTPVFRPKRRKNPPDGAAHTFLAYIREYPPPLPVGSTGWAFPVVSDVNHKSKNSSFSSDLALAAFMLKRGFFLKSSESSGYFAYQKCLNSSFAVFFIPFGILWEDWFLKSQYKCIPWGNWVLCRRTTMEQQDEFKICLQQQEQYYLFKR